MSANNFSVERALRLIAGAFILLSLALAQVHHPYWLFFTAFVGLNLLQSGVTNWCPMVWLLEKLGMRRCNREGMALASEARRSLS